MLLKSSRILLDQFLESRKSKDLTITFDSLEYDSTNRVKFIPSIKKILNDIFKIYFPSLT